MEMILYIWFYFFMSMAGPSFRLRIGPVCVSAKKKSLKIIFFSFNCCLYQNSNYLYQCKR